MAGTWAGVEDLGDNKLQQLYAEYSERCELVRDLKAGSKNKLKESCDALLSSSHKDDNFLTTGEQVARIHMMRHMMMSWAHIGYEELQKKLVNIKRTFHVNHDFMHFN